MKKIKGLKILLRIILYMIFKNKDIFIINFNLFKNLILIQGMWNLSLKGHIFFGKLN